MSTSTTFKVCNLTPEEVKPIEKRAAHPVTYLKGYDEHKCIRILKGTEFNGNVRPENNGFIQTVLNAYNGHHNLVIRPDDVWIAIATQFSFYVNANAEKFREKFVNFSGQKELVVGIPGCLDSAPYDLFVELMTKEIHENLVDEEIKNWLLPNFTTTTKDDTITCGVLFMATMKEYFLYTCVMCCGIPSVTLEGTVEDWKKIQGRLEKLKAYGLEDWVNLLEPIIEEFIQAKLGSHNEDFWQKICHYESLGSGGERNLCGWLSTFSFFDGNGKRQGYTTGTVPWPRIRLENLSPGVVEVNVKIDDNGAIYKSVMFAGHMGGEALEDGKSLQPRSGWVIALKPDDEKKNVKA